MPLADWDPAQARIHQRRDRRNVGRFGRQWRVERIVGVGRIPRIARRGNQFGALLTPPGAQEQGALEPRDGEVEDDELVHVVTTDGPVDEVLRVRERRGIGQHGVEFRTHIGQGAQCGFEVLQVAHQVGLRIGDQAGGQITEGAELLQRRGDLRLLLDQDLQRRRDAFERLGEHVTLAREHIGQTIQ